MTVALGSLGHVNRDLVGKGVYDYAEVESVLHISSSMLARIALPDPTGRRPALVRPEHSWCFTFRELVSVSVVVTLRLRQIDYDAIWAVEQQLAEEYGTPWPFAHRAALARLSTSGQDLLIDRERTAAGQLVIREAAELYLKLLHFDSDDYADRWEAGDGIVLDPAVQAGAPCIAGTRVPTEVVADRVTEGEPEEVVAEDLSLTLIQVRQALEFEDCLTRRGLASMPAAA